MKKSILFAIVVALVCSGCDSSSDNGRIASSSTPQQFANSQPTPASSPIHSTEQSKEQADVEVIATRANLRVMANASSDVVTELEKGAQLKLLSDGAVGAWYNVKDLDSSKTGWIHGNAISIVSAKTNNSRTKATIDTRNDTAQAGDQNGDNGDSDTYKNKDGIEVPRPRHSDRVPAGASARCRDGTYSFSLNRRGTCSHHGGVAEWL